MGTKKPKIPPEGLTVTLSQGQPEELAQLQEPEPLCPGCQLWMVSRSKQWTGIGQIYLCPYCHCLWGQAELQDYEQILFASNGLSPPQRYWRKFRIKVQGKLFGGWYDIRNRHIIQGGEGHDRRGNGDVNSTVPSGRGGNSSARGNSG